jgi:glycosyltransferase involved in cell wall biosynthesis
MEISIIIPTHNRAKILNTCLKRIYENKFPINKFEVIIVDDASTDNTEQIARKWKRKGNIQYFLQSKSGQGVARNKAIEIAKGKILIFIGDDIFINNHFLQEHYQSHQQYSKKNFAILGLTLWDPEININEIMQWSTNASQIFGKFGGHQFAFEKLRHNKPADFNFFYTSNISLKKEVFQNNKFDPWFDGYGWEDIELGYRLTKNEDLKIIYNANAIAYHHHEIDLSQFKNRMIQIGKATHLINFKHPQLKKMPTAHKKFIFSIISNNFSLKFLEILNKIFQNKLNPIYFYCLSKNYYLKGLKQVPNKLKK